MPADVRYRCVPSQLTEAARASAPIYDDKAHVRGKLDLTDAEWQRAAEPAPTRTASTSRSRSSPHTDGKTYMAMRNSKHTGPDDTVLVFTESRVGRLRGRRQGRRVRRALVTDRESYAVSGDSNVRPD